MRLRASNRTPNKDSPSDSRLQRLERLLASPWVGGLLASRHESNRLRIAPGEMPVHKDHQGKASTAFAPRSPQLLPFVPTRRQVGTWVLGFVLRIDAQRAGAEAPDFCSPKLQLFVQPGVSGHVCAGELRSPTQRLLYEVQHAGAVRTFHSHHVVFVFFFLFRVRNVSEKCHLGNLIMINLTTHGGIEGPALHACGF